MNTSKPSSRCRPGLGTLIRVQVDNEKWIEPMYARITEMEKIFNFHDPESELSRWNRGERKKFSQEFSALMEFALALKERSGATFDPFVNGPLDLGGVAKGFAVDEAVELALRLDPRAKGFVEAGGDIRYFGESEVDVALRLGVPPQVVTRNLKLTGSQMSIASSSAGMAEHFGETKTTLSFGVWPQGSSITVIASHCRVADALTKVVLMGGLSKLPSLNQDASAMVFDAAGELIESSFS